MIGHKSAECTARINEVENLQDNKEESQIGSVDIGRVWNSCQVEIASRIETSNRFGVVCEDDDEGEKFPDLSSGASEFSKPKCAFHLTLLMKLFTSAITRSGLSANLLHMMVFLW